MTLPKIQPDTARHGSGTLRVKFRGTRDFLQVRNLLRHLPEEQRAALFLLVDDLVGPRAAKTRATLHLDDL